jgi:hypothetical protein
MSFIRVTALRRAYERLLTWLAFGPDVWHDPTDREAPQ